MRNHEIFLKRPAKKNYFQNRDHKLGTILVVELQKKETTYANTFHATSTKERDSDQKKKKKPKKGTKYTHKI